MADSDSNQNQNQEPIQNQNPPIDPPAPVEPAVVEGSIKLGDDVLFSADDIKAKQSELKATKAETDRRAKLTPEDLKKEDDAAAAAKADKTVPEAYAEFKVPDGMSVDKEMLADAAPLFKELGLSQNNAQKVVDLYASKVYPAFIKRQADQWNDVKESWKGEVKADKEIGGPPEVQVQDLPAVKEAQRALNTLGTDALKKVFDEFGLGNHPEFVRVFARMAKHLKEDTVEVGGKGKPVTNTFEGIASVLYDKTK